MNENNPLRVDMQPYLALLRRRLPKKVMRVIDGEVPLPRDFIQLRPWLYGGYPPALIPFLGAVSAWRYDGSWWHWFVPRVPVYARAYFEGASSVREMSRTDDQFLIYLLVSLFRGGAEAGEVRPTYEALGISKSFESILSIVEVDEWEERIQEEPEFQEKVPLGLSPSAYDGEFPRAASDKLGCGLELPEELAPPPSPGTQMNRFRRLLLKGDLGGAWLSLNSRGWGYAEAKEAMRALRRRANSSEFSEFADAWLAQGHDDGHGY